MSNNLPRGLPWIDWDEWTTVKNCMYSKELKDQISALECVAVWRLRGKLPHSVESTAQLLEIGINDHSETKHFFGSIWRSENELRMQYSLAIIRSVNGLVDSSQQGYFAESIYGLANAIGLPGWFVELRHDATHNQIPSLNVMRAASSRLIAWYFTNYWLPQSEYLKSVTSLCLTSNLSVKKNAQIVELTNKEERKLQQQQQQQQQQQRNNISSETISTQESPTFDSLIKSSGSTFVTGIFIPIFFCSIFNHGMPENTILMRKIAKMKKTKKMCDFWWNRILKIQELHPIFFSVLSVRLFVTAIDCTDNEIKNPQKERNLPQGNMAGFEVDWRQYVCRSWVEKLFVQTVNQIVNSQKARKLVSEINICEEVRNNYWNQSSRSSSNVLSAVRSRYEQLEDGERSSLQEIFAFSEMICDSEGLTKCVLSVLEEIKRQNGVDDITLTAAAVSQGDDDARCDNGNEGCDENGEEEAEERESDGEEGGDLGSRGSGSATDQDGYDDEDDDEDVDASDQEDVGLESADSGPSCVDRHRAECGDSNYSHSAISSSGSSCKSNKRPREDTEEEEEEEVGHGVLLSLRSSGVSADRTSKEKSSSSSENQSIRKVLTHRPSGWFTCDDHSVWPLGQIPGHSESSTHSSCPLYLIREAGTRDPGAGESKLLT